MSKTTDNDASFSLLTSMKFLILNGECLNYTVNQFPDYVKFSLSKFLIPKLVLAKLVDLLVVVLRIDVASAVFQPYGDLEAGDNQSLKF